ncbi:hypothetical protein D3C73_1634980 [compost metagenome]
MAAARQRPLAGYGTPLNARIRVVHGAELIADNSESEARMLADFEAWIHRLEAESRSTREHSPQS